jgi:hypothetical protein
MKGFSHDIALSSAHMHAEKESNPASEPQSTSSGNREHGVPRYFADDDYLGYATGRMHHHGPSSVANSAATMSKFQHGVLPGGSNLVDERHPMYPGQRGQGGHEAQHAPERMPPDRERKRQESPKSRANSRRIQQSWALSSCGTCYGMLFGHIASAAGGELCVLRPATSRRPSLRVP